MANKELARGVGSAGRSKAYHKKGLWAIKKKNGGKFPSHAKKEKAAEVPAKVQRAFLFRILLSYLGNGDVSQL